jgi:hypothetical protein
VEELGSLLSFDGILVTKMAEHPDLYDDRTSGSVDSVGECPLVRRAWMSGASPGAQSTTFQLV